MNVDISEYSKIENLDFKFRFRLVRSASLRSASLFHQSNRLTQKSCDAHSNAHKYAHLNAHKPETPTICMLDISISLLSKGYLIVVDVDYSVLLLLDNSVLPCCLLA